MSRLLEFFQNNPVLCIAFVGLAIGAAVTTWQSIARGAKKVTVSEATRMMNSDEAVVVDVRGDSDFRGGHIIDAVNMPYTTFKDRMKQLEKYKSRPLIAACRTGQQSSAAVGQLRKAGFENVFVLGGGMLAWQDANLPTTKGA